MARGVAGLILLLILAQIVTALVINDTLLKVQDNTLKGVKTRRKESKSTSSDASSVEALRGKDGEGSESLNVEFTDSSSYSTDIDEKKKTNTKKKDKTPVSTIERTGWRKWHRKCQKCPEDMNKKWRDPSIKWICGAYQRARRSFKSVCMMHMRNCQDGTMFTKIADSRCPNGTSNGIHPYNLHFFYDYKVELTDETRSSKTRSSDSDEDVSTSISESELAKRVPAFRLD